jgi:MbtH protein
MPRPSGRRRGNFYLQGKEGLLREQCNEDLGKYFIVVNHEEQYSVWPVDKQIPSGWRRVGEAGSKEECMRQITEIWADMRPLSLRRAMSSGVARRPPES